jgi:hypothetical protein
MTIFIEENGYHADILNCGFYTHMSTEDNNYIFTRKQNFIDNEENIEFSFFVVIAYLIRLKIGGQNMIYFNTIEKPQSAMLFFFAKLLGFDVICVVHNFDAFVDFGNNVKFKKKLFRFVFGRTIICNSKVYVLTKDVFNYVNQNCFVKNNVACSILNLDWLRIGLNNDLQGSYKVVLGAVDFSRRNYSALIDYVRCNPNEKILVLGNVNSLDGPVFHDNVHKENLEQQFVFFSSFVKQDDFLNYVNNAMSIVDITLGEGYGKYKSSSTRIIASALGKDVIDI